MHKTETEILKYMKKFSSKELSTSELVKYVFSSESRQIQEQSAKDFNMKKDVSHFKKINAKLHRNILYHLNNLVDDELIRVSRQGNKGEKYFRLNLEEGEELIFEKKHRRIVISRPSLPAMPIEGFEKQGILFKFEPESWINRLNAIMVQSGKFNSLKSLNITVNSLFNVVNDCIGINDFEKIIQESDLSELKAFVGDMVSACEDYGMRLTIIIDIKNILNEASVIDFIKELTIINKQQITLILDTTVPEFHKHTELIKKVISLYSYAGMRLYIKNESLHRPPYLIGRAGPYTFSVADYEYHKKMSKSITLPVASISIAVDVKKFFELKMNINQFRKLITNILKTLFLASSAQRTRSEEFFGELLRINSPYSANLFKSSRNYIRFWNYGWKEEKMDQNVVIDLIKSTKKEVDDFCMNETSIFKACGMPTDFKMAFSCAFQEFNEKLSGQEFKRMQIKKIDDLYKKDYKEYLKAKELISAIFDGGDRMRLVRSRDVSSDDIIREIDLILNVYKIPLFCFDFSGLRGGDLKLTSFIKNE